MRGYIDELGYGEVEGVEYYKMWLSVKFGDE
jgi:hypothetical protein